MFKINKQKIKQKIKQIKPVCHLGRALKICRFFDYFTAQQIKTDHPSIILEGKVGFFLFQLRNSYFLIKGALVFSLD